MWVTTTRERRSDGGKVQVHEIVVKALEEHDGIDVESGEWTLYDYIDPDSLDALFSKEGNTVTAVEFTVKGATVTVWQDGEVHAKVE
ncbi:HalOD1 output domain-containing protein [Haladaptatus salinisoli]|uniref:HalOD1 output domain-containing protein n=1 Tax=Haladaptatus salinisoli TaxID=2884876 RepID=UPI001D0AB46F|nr:HalOD1 output domain-containing protein [Haladaptatus salinisoli]